MRFLRGFGFFLAAGLVAINGWAESPQAKTPKEIRQTIGGVLQVVPIADGGYGLMLGKTKIKAVPDDDFVFIDKAFKVDGKDIVLVSTNCGGSGCSWTNWYFLTITSNSKVEVTSAIAAAENDTPVVQLENKKITFKTVEQDGRRKKTRVWIFENGTLRQQQ